MQALDRWQWFPSSLVARSRRNGLELQSEWMQGVPFFDKPGRRVTLEDQVLFALRHDRHSFVKLTLGVVGYAASHSLLALSAGAVAVAWGRTPFDHPALPAAWSWSPSIATASYVGLASAIVKAVTGTLLSASEKRLAASVSGRLRLALIQRFLDAGTGMPAPSALALIAVRLREIEGAVVSGVLGRARGVAQLVPLGACLFVLSPKLALGAVAIVTPFAVVLARLRRRMRSATARSQSTVEALERSVDELVRNVDLFRAYGAGKRAVDSVARTSTDATELSARLEGARALASGFNEAMAALVVVGVVALSERFGVPAGGAAFVPFAAVFFMAYRPLRDLGDAKAWLERGSVALGAVSDAVENGDEAPGSDWLAVCDQPAPRRSPTRDYSRTPPEIVLADFGGTHHGGRATLRIAPGEIVCIVGPTGSGKTTLLRAMLGLEAAGGRMRIDGKDVVDAPSGPEHRPFAWVPQDAPLVTATVADNVALFGGSNNVEEALRTTGAGNLAAADELVGPGGRSLSGGERRLLALARAFATQLPVLLLDEPTEGLDAVATVRVLGAVERLRGRRSVLVATHRSEVVAIADRVVEIRGRDTARDAAE